MTRCMQFLNEVKHKFVEQETEEDFYYLFDSLQLAAVIHGTSNGDCFCVHGGIGPSIKTVESIDSFMRFQVCFISVSSTIIFSIIVVVF